jgi:hypothetical protein
MGNRPKADILNPFLLKQLDRVPAVVEFVRVEPPLTDKDSLVGLGSEFLAPLIIRELQESVSMDFV